METRTVQRLTGVGVGLCSLGFLAIAVGEYFQGAPLSVYWIPAISALVFSGQTVYLLVNEPDRERSKAWRVGQTAGSVLLFVIGVVLLYFGMQELQQAFF